MESTGNQKMLRFNWALASPCVPLGWLKLKIPDRLIDKVCLAPFHMWGSVSSICCFNVVLVSPHECYICCMEAWL